MRDQWAEPILHVDMDAFFVEVERLRNRELRGIPVVVGGTGGRSVVAAASYEARRYGISSALPMVRARRLCPDLVIVPPDHREYARVSEQVFAIFRSFTPLVEGMSVDEAFLDVSGLRLHHQGPGEVARAVRAAIRSRLDLPASVGIASTKFVAKLASEAAKPDGIRHVTRANQDEFLSALPVRALWGVGRATQASLASLGVETVSDLLSVPDSRLRSAVGAALALHLTELARGVDPRPVTPDDATKSISAEETYESNLATGEEISTGIRSLADRVGHRLRRAGLVARTISLKMRFPDFTTVSRSETLASATDVDIEIHNVALRLASKAGRDGRAVRLLGIAASALTEAHSPAQLTVENDERWRDLGSAIDAVRLRYGHDSVLPAALAPEKPEEGTVH